jgi:hypothetical protein
LVEWQFVQLEHQLAAKFFPQNGSADP